MLVQAYVHVLRSTFETWPVPTHELAFGLTIHVLAQLTHSVVLRFFKVHFDSGYNAVCSVPVPHGTVGYELHQHARARVGARLPDVLGAADLSRLAHSVHVLVV